MNCRPLWVSNCTWNRALPTRHLLLTGMYAHSYTVRVCSMNLLCANQKQGYTSANFQAAIILLAICVFGGQILALAWRHIAVPILFWLKTSVISLQRSHSKLDNLWDPPCKMLLGTVCNLRKCKVCVLFDLNGVQLNSLYMWIHAESETTSRSAKDVKIPWIKKMCHQLYLHLLHTSKDLLRLADENSPAYAWHTGASSAIMRHAVGIQDIYISAPIYSIKHTYRAVD